MTPLFHAVVMLSAWLVAVPAAAVEDQAQAVVEKMVDQALAVLRNPALKAADKRAERLDKLKAISNEGFDWADMAKRSLGYHWRSIDDRQRERYVDLFKTLLADHYRNDLDRFQGDERVVFQGEEASGDERIVRTVVVTHSHDRVPMDYYLHRVGGKWRVYDLSIENVSLVNHYRGLFNRFLVNNTFDQMLQRLARKQESEQP